MHLFTKFIYVRACLNVWFMEMLGTESKTLYKPVSARSTIKLHSLPYYYMSSVLLMLDATVNRSFFKNIYC